MKGSIERQWRLKSPITTAYWKLRFQLQSSVAKNWSLKPWHFTISSWKTQKKKNKKKQMVTLFKFSLWVSCSIMWVLHVIIHPNPLTCEKKNRLEKHLVCPQTIRKARPTFLFVGFLARNSNSEICIGKTSGQTSNFWSLQKFWSLPKKQ